MPSPRARTMQHMKRLASLAAAGAALSGAASSSNGYGVVDPLPSPPKCGNVATTIPPSAIVRAGEGGRAWVLAQIEIPSDASAGTAAKVTLSDSGY